MASPEPELPWYQTFFTEDYLEPWMGGRIDEERTKQETSFIVDALDLAPGTRLAGTCAHMANLR